MTYRGRVSPTGYPVLGIKPTKADREYVQALSVMGITVREMCVRLGDRLKLGKPMSRMSLYHHFRRDLIPKNRGRHPKDETLRERVANNIVTEMQKLIADAKKRGKAKTTA